LSRDSPPCPICGGGSAPCFVAAEYRFYRCSSCRTAFVSPVPSDKALCDFYDTFHQTEGKGGMYDAFEDRMQADFPAKIDLVLNTFNPDKPERLLDVGCGKGYFVHACVDRGLNAEGIDLSVSAIEFARKKLGIKAYSGSLADLKNELGLFDAATFWATIEHLPDPIRMLRDISDILRPGGRLLLDTGLGDDWLDRLLPGRVQWYDPPQHLYVFSRGGLRAALAKAGIRIERFEPNFERSSLRRIVKTLRNAAVATGLRAAAELGRAVQNEPTFVRFALGNLASITAVKEGAA
jgi:SAM-dependent methyltransferase